MPTARDSDAERVASRRPGAAADLPVPALTAGLLAVIAGLHAVWAASPWPFASREEFARTVVGVDVEQTPAPASSLLVAGALLAGALVVLAGAGLARMPGPERFVRLSLWGLAAVLGLRGVAGLLTSATELFAAPEAYRRMDLMLYSPLCLLLAAGVLRTLRNGSRR